MLTTHLGLTSIGTLVYARRIAKIQIGDCRNLVLDGRQYAPHAIDDALFLEIHNHQNLTSVMWQQNGISVIPDVLLGG